MPEGPELRTVADQLRPVLVGGMLVGLAWKSHTKIVRLEQISLPVSILTVESRGKRLLITLSSGFLGSFLAMTGRWFWSNWAANQFATREDVKVNCLTENATVGSWPSRPGLPITPREEAAGLLSYLKVVLHFRWGEGADATASALCFSDVRGFGGLAYIRNGLDLACYFSDIGPDLLELALNGGPDEEAWLGFLSKKNCANRQICQVLMDQSVVAGIGNYLKAEILYDAGIRPDRLTFSLSREEKLCLLRSTQRIIVESYRVGGLTIENFRAPDGRHGAYQRKVYGQTLDPLGRKVVTETFKDGRSTHWVPEAQH